MRQTKQPLAFAQWELYIREKKTYNEHACPSTYIFIIVCQLSAKVVIYDPSGRGAALSQNSNAPNETRKFNMGNLINLRYAVLTLRRKRKFQVFWREIEPKISVKMLRTDGRMGERSPALMERETRRCGKMSRTKTRKKTF